MFSVVSCLYMRDPMWPLPRMHWILLYMSPPYPSSLCTGFWSLFVQGPALKLPYRALAPDPVQGPSSVQIGPSASDIWWPRLETCSNLFTWRPHCTGPPLPLVMHWWLPTEARMYPTGMLSCHCLQWSCGKVIFSQVCVKNSVHRGVSASVHAGIHPPGRHPLGRHPPVDTPWTDTPQADTPWVDTPVGTHPTGMHSCISFVYLFLVYYTSLSWHIHANHKEKNLIEENLTEVWLYDKSSGSE